MTKSTRLQIRIAPEKKARCEKLFESFGLNMSSAVNLFIDQCLRDGHPSFLSNSNASQESKGENNNLQ